MTTTFDPEQGIWWERGDARWPRVKVIANPEDRNVMLVRDYGNDTPAESIELHVDSLAEIEALLANARQWLRTATPRPRELTAGPDAHLINNAPEEAIA